MLIFDTLKNFAVFLSVLTAVADEIRKKKPILINDDMLEILD